MQIRCLRTQALRLVGDCQHLLLQAGLAYVLLHAYASIAGVYCAEWQLCTLMPCAQLSSKLIPPAR